MLRETFVVADVSPGFHDPAEGAFDFPAAGQDDEACCASGSPSVSTMMCRLRPLV